MLRWPKLATFMEECAWHRGLRHLRGPAPHQAEFDKPA